MSETSTGMASRSAWLFAHLLVQALHPLTIGHLGPHRRHSAPSPAVLLLRQARTDRHRAPHWAFVADAISRRAIIRVRERGEPRGPRAGPERRCHDERAHGARLLPTTSAAPRGEFRADGDRRHRHQLRVASAVVVPVFLRSRPCSARKRTASAADGARPFSAVGTRKPPTDQAPQGPPPMAFRGDHDPRAGLRRASSSATFATPFTAPRQLRAPPRRRPTSRQGPDEIAETRRARPLSIRAEHGDGSRACSGAARRVSVSLGQCRTAARASASPRVTDASRSSESILAAASAGAARGSPSSPGRRQGLM